MNITQKTNLQYYRGGDTVINTPVGDTEIQVGCNIVYTDENGKQHLTCGVWKDTRPYIKSINSILITEYNKWFYKPYSINDDQITISQQINPTKYYKSKLKSLIKQAKDNENHNKNNTETLNQIEKYINKL